MLTKEEWKFSQRARKLKKDQTSPKRLEEKLDHMRMRWAGTDYEIVVEKLDMMTGSNVVVDKEKVLESILMIENDEVTLIEEGEDILDGLKMMEEREDISEDILLDATEMITCLIISMNLDTDRMMPTFQKDGNSEKQTTERIKSIGRASGRTKMRKEMDKFKNNRKEGGSRVWTPEDFNEGAQETTTLRS